MLRPKHLWLEVTNRCNARCIFCRRDCIKEACDMDFELYKKIIDSCPFAAVVQTQGTGEPLLYPQIVEAVAYAKKKGRRLLFYTNASLLTTDMAEKLLEAGLTQINFSVDECTKENYEKLRVGLKWVTVLRNIQDFQHLRDRRGYDTKTVVRICRTRENQERIKWITEFWTNRVDLISVQPEVYIPPPEILLKNRYITAAPVDCFRPYEHLSVKANGDLVLCCRDWFSIYKFGNLTDNNVLDTFNNEKFSRIRRLLESGIAYPTICYYCKNPVPIEEVPR